MVTVEYLTARQVEMYDTGWDYENPPPGEGWYVIRQYRPEEDPRIDGPYSTRKIAQWTAGIGGAP